nr:MAG TPA: hypothetical protein [Caudoviricetes sp.]
MDEQISLSTGTACATLEMNVIGTLGCLSKSQPLRSVIKQLGNGQCY